MLWPTVCRCHKYEIFWFYKCSILFQSDVKEIQNGQQINIFLACCWVILCYLNVKSQAGLLPVSPRLQNTHLHTKLTNIVLALCKTYVEIFDVHRACTSCQPPFPANHCERLLKLENNRRNDQPSQKSLSSTDICRKKYYSYRRNVKQLLNRL